MFAQLPHSKTARLLAALALMLGLGLAGGASKPASADASQWQRPQSSWNQGSGWNRQWHNSQSHHRNQFNNRSQIIIQGILTNFFDSDVKYNLLTSVFDAKRFGDAHVAQIVIADGWLGLSLMTK